MREPDERSAASGGGAEARSGALFLSRRNFLLVSAFAASALHSRAARATGAQAWSSHGHDLAQTRHNRRESEITANAAARLHLDWEFEAGSGITGTPAIVGERVVVGSWDGNVYALALRSGKLLWKFSAGTRIYPPDRRLGIYASPAVSGSTVYAVSDRLIALALDDGHARWERTIGEPSRTLEYFWAPPLVDGDRLYAGVSAGSETQTRGRVVCVDARNGELLWSFFTVAKNVAGGALLAPPSLDPADRTLYAVTGNPFRPEPGALRHSNSLIVLDADTGRLRWADQLHPHDTRNLDLNCAPLLLSIGTGPARRRLVLAGGKDGLRAWDRDSRRRLWRVQLTPAVAPGETEALPTSGPEAGPLASAGGLLFFASNNHADRTSVLAAIEAATGDLRWVHTLPAFQAAPMSIAGGVVFMGLLDGKLRAWRATDGELLWEFDAGAPIAGGPAIASGRVIVGTGAGAFLPGRKLLCFALKRS